MPYGCGRGLTNSRFVELASKRFEGKYDYSSCSVTGKMDKAFIICELHGEFTKVAHLHLSGQGCPKCAKISAKDGVRRTADEFISEARALHGDTFDYSEVIYSNAETRVRIKCPRHGVFLQTPSSHLNGRGCRKCSKLVSKPETAWLDKLEVPVRQIRFKVAGRVIPIEVDGYDPDTNTVYEFYGDYWHGNPRTFVGSEFNPQAKKTYKELYDSTMHREELLRSAGFTVVSIWESDWNESCRSSN